MNEAHILARTHVPYVIVPALIYLVVERSASPWQPRPHGFPGRIEQFESHGALGLLPNHDRSVANPSAGDDIADPYLDDVAAAQLAIDSEVEQWPITPFRPRFRRT